MKKVKLFATIASLCLAVAVLCFGVFSATQISYTIGGTISYEVNDVFVQITTKVYKSKVKQNMDKETLILTAQTDFEDKTFDEIDSTKYDLYKDDIPVFPSIDAQGDTAIGSATGINIDYNQSYQYFIVVNIKSYTSDLKAYALVNKVTEGANSNVYMTPYTNDIIKPADVTFDDATNKGKTIVIAYGLSDPKASIDSSDNNFEYSINIEKGEYVEDTYFYSDDGFFFDFNDDNKTVYLSGYSGESTEVEIPATLGDYVITKEKQEWVSTKSSDAKLTEIIILMFNGELDFISMTVGETTNKLATIQDLANVLQTNLDDDSESFKQPVIISLNIECSKNKYTDFGQAFFEQLSFFIDNNITFDIQLGNNEKINCSSVDTLNTIKSSINADDESQFPIKVLDSVINKKGFKRGKSYKVTKIGDESFESNSTITSVKISNGIKEIGEKAFFNCENLTTLEIPSSVEKIGVGGITRNSLFSTYEYDKNGLGFLYASDNKNVKFWLGIQKDTKIENITEEMLKGVKFIGEDAFEHHVEYNAIDYSGYSYVKTIEIPANVVGFIGNPFTDCVLDSIKVNTNNRYYTSGNNNNYLLEIETGRYMKGTNIETAEIPNNGTVKIIEGGAFLRCTNLENLTLPNGLTEIGASAFSACSKIKSIVIPSTVYIIYSGSFSGCDNLESVKFEDINNWHDIYTGDFSDVDNGIVNWSSTNFSENVELLKRTQAYQGIGYLIKQ